MGLYNRIRTSWKLAAWMLYLSLSVSLGAMLIYLIDFNYNDRTLYVLLLIIRYSSFILCICALYKLIINIYHFLKRPGFRRALKSAMYILMIFYGIVMVFIESVIVAVSKGNM